MLYCEAGQIGINIIRLKGSPVGPVSKLYNKCGLPPPPHTHNPLMPWKNLSFTLSSTECCPIMLIDFPIEKKREAENWPTHVKDASQIF